MHMFKKEHIKTRKLEYNRNKFSYVLIIVKADWQVCEFQYIILFIFAYDENYHNKELKINGYAEQVLFMAAVMLHSGAHNSWSTGTTKW